MQYKLRGSETKTLPTAIKETGWYWIQAILYGEWELAHFKKEKKEFMTLNGKKIPQFVDPRPVKRHEPFGIKQEAVRLMVEGLEVGQSICVYTFIVNEWGAYDEYIRRSYDVMFAKVKKANPENEYKNIRRTLTRLK